MMKKIAWILFLAFTFLIFYNVPITLSKETVTFPSKDGLPITADLHIAHKNKETPFILFFHQAGWSRGEYLEIAPKLNQLGFNCMAVDLRSGRGINDIPNETAIQARSKELSTNYLDALPDMESALLYARKNLANGKIIAWGSSYSAALVLKLAGDKPELIDGLLSFAPGEYFVRLGKSNTWIEESSRKIQSPVFITSAREEKQKWFAIFKAIPSRDKTFYLPKSKGNHGSRALWDRFSDSQGYWKAVKDFLGKHFSSL